MENKDLVDGKLGSVGTYDVAFKDGALVVAITENDKFGATSITRSIPAKQVLDALKAAIPGQIDDAVINTIEVALGL